MKTLYIRYIRFRAILISISDFRVLKILTRSFKKLEYLVMFNCGGRLDLTEKLMECSNEKLKIILLDSHRPIHHNNINNVSKRLILIDDESLDRKNCPNNDDLVILEHASDDGEDNNEMMEEFFDNVEKQALGNIEKIEKGEDGNNDKEDDKLDDELQIKDDDKEKISENEVQEDKQSYTPVKSNGNKLEKSLVQEEEEEIELGKKRIKRRLEDKKNRKKLKEAIQTKVEKYYKGSYTGNCVTGILYKLSQQLNKENNEFLWYWILGVTDQFTSYKINQNKYEQLTSELQREVMRLNMTQTSQNNFFQTASKKLQNIVPENRLNMFLLEFWNLYDSLLYSSYTIPKLKTWHETGKSKLKQLIAKMGIPLDEAKQKFSHLEPKYKTNIQDKFTSMCDEYNLSEILVPTFTKIIDNKHSYNSFNMCEVINFLLNYPNNFNEQVLKLNKDEQNDDDNYLFQLNLEENFWSVFHQILEM